MGKDDKGRAPAASAEKSIVEKLASYKEGDMIVIKLHDGHLVRGVFQEEDGGIVTVHPVPVGIKKEEIMDVESPELMAKQINAAGLMFLRK
ncbi:hypothetical protein [Pseudomonas fluorescens]|uniref:Uncharacterized protein n=1 Tax=Pseudomonas fluorescens TaxID=294 RepID=A0A423LHG9_PSEFL|nr:hypothetical protein [Pseudomonas fluorescens]RON67771.1 hypothetical protein BK671_12530 [Pseudomonas fluorescens]